MDCRQLVFYISVCVGSACIHSVAATPTIDDAYNLHRTLFSNYNRNVRPINDQNSAINVNVVMYIKSMQEFDEVNERYSFGAAFFIDWLDVKLKWNESDYNGLSQITVPYDDVWVPELILGNPSNTFLSIGRSSDKMRIDNTGTVSWTPAALIESTCAVNVRNYPFDTQTCKTSFISLGYRTTEVVLIALSSKIVLNYYSPNALWDITDTNVVENTFGETGQSELIFTYYLKRKPTLVVITIIMPIVLLNMVNSFVFLLVPECGERIGYCITTLLAIAVYMTIVSDILPQNAEHIPLITYKLFLDLLTSILIALCTILNLRLYHRADNHNVPNWLKRWFERLTACRRRKAQEKEKDQRQQEEDIQEDADDLPITWKKVSYMLDWIALFTFTFLNLINCVVYLGIARH